MIIASAGVFGTGVPAGIFCLLGLRILFFVKRRRERNRLYASLDPADAQYVRTVYSRIVRSDVRARMIWAVGFFATLFGAVSLVNLLLGPGWRNVAAALVLWLTLMFVYGKLTRHWRYRV